MSRERGKTSWYRGSFLLERPRDTEVAHVEKTVASLIGAWKKETGLQEEGLLLRRLAAEGLDVETFSSLLASMNEPGMPGEEGWLRLMEEIFGAADETAPSDRERLDYYTSSFGFAKACWPFLLWAQASYEKSWETLRGNVGKLPFCPRGITEHFLRSLTEQLTELLLRTLSLELNVARLRGQLSGETAEQRFRSFAENHLTETEDILELLEEYPVLARLLVTRTVNSVNATTEAVERFCHDRDRIAAQFGTGLAHFTEVNGGLSDHHRFGRSALAFVFEGGQRLMYKPKSLAVSHHFQDLLGWVNEMGAEPSFPILKVLDREEYGWEEFVEAKGCSSIEEVRRFYRRQGGYLALLYLLKSTDFHYENVIAVGEHPYLVDLETLFQHRVEDEHADKATNKAMRLLRESVLGTGLLPFFVGGGPGEEATDFGGLGGTEGQSTPVEVLRWEGVGTDDMRAVRRHDVLEEGSNRPRLEGNPKGVKDHVEDFLEGFEDTYKLLAVNKEALAEQVLRFRDDPVRQVLRPTYVYSLFLEGGYHPDFLRNGLDRDRLMDRLWVSLRYASNAEGVVPSERQDLLNDDIPYFYTRPGSKSLWDSRDLCTNDFFATDSLTEVLHRCRALGEEDRELQKEFIRASLGAGGRRHLQIRSAERSLTAQARTDAFVPEKFIDGALEIAEWLEETAVWGDGRRDVSWLSLQWVGEEKWQLNPVDVGLYNGLTGIAFFLAHLADACGQKRFEHTARAAMRSAEYLLEESPAAPGVSAFRGRASFIYALMHLSNLWGDRSLLERALHETRLLGEEVSSDTSFDLLDGSAGAVIVLLHLHRFTQERLPYEVAMACGEHLLTHARETPEGHAWKIPVAEKPLAGLSHGASGFAWALSFLTQVSGEERFLRMAHSALRYERSLYHPGQRNWLDLRTERGATGDGPLPVAWCHGAPGIGIVRVLCSEMLQDAVTEADLEVALQTTRDRGFGRGHSLCHGDFGNLELLLLAASRRGDASLLEEARRMGALALAGATERGRWATGWGHGDDEEPGLMIGTAGIGLGLLRLATNQKVPSPVYLAPPESRR